MFPGRKCEKCGAEVRLFGIEAHSTDEVLTYVCPACQAISTAIKTSVVGDAA